MTIFQNALKGKDAVQYLEKKLGASNDILTNFPKYIMIETVNFCNANCIMCGIDFTKKLKSVMKDELYDKILAEIIAHKDEIEKVMLYLDCEPLLDKKLPARIEMMKKGGVKKTNISTNAELLDEVRGTKIINAGLDEIYINLDSLHKDRFEIIRKGLNFDTVYKNIINFIQLRNKLNPKLVIRMQMICQDLNADEGETWIEHWKPKLNPHDQIIVQKNHNWASAYNAKNFGDEFSINNVPCIGPFGTFCIHVDGTVGLCSMDTDPKPNGTTGEGIGTVATKSIAEVWTGEPVKRVRDIHIAGERCKIKLCDGCTLWREDKHLMEEILRSK
jgi:organic radical activating enzyme